VSEPARRRWRPAHLEDFVVSYVYQHWSGTTITGYDDDLLCRIGIEDHTTLERR
jgi:hypothetical protein